MVRRIERLRDGRDVRSDIRIRPKVGPQGVAEGAAIRIGCDRRALLPYSYSECFRRQPLGLSDSRVVTWPLPPDDPHAPAPVRTDP